MKPKNFPGRKNDRRKDALSRLNVTVADRPQLAQRVKDILICRILPDDMARSIRTKKDRSARGKLRA